MKYKLTIEGMSCVNCVRHVSEALSEMGGTDIDIDLDSKSAFVTFSREVKDNELTALIDDAGYELTGIALMA